MLFFCSKTEKVNIIDKKTANKLNKKEPIGIYFRIHLIFQPFLSNNNASETHIETPIRYIKKAIKKAVGEKDILSPEKNEYIITLISQDITPARIKRLLYFIRKIQPINPYKEAEPIIAPKINPITYAPIFAFYTTMILKNTNKINCNKYNLYRCMEIKKVGADLMGR